MIPKRIKYPLTASEVKRWCCFFSHLTSPSTCTRELYEVRDNFQFYKQLDTEVVVISVDSFYTNAKFKEMNGLNFPILSDFNKDVSKAYDSPIEDFAFDYHG
ncbi:MAG: redoxin domain-containing protein, partial [Chitinophagales bacterium]|nr:redoxin domain-containing protein [Chitinophagales bacterium]